jgi:hypothetical protein
MGGIEFRAAGQLGYRPAMRQPVPPHLAAEVPCHATGIAAIRASHEVIVPW